MTQERSLQSAPAARARPHQHRDAIMVLMNLMFARHLIGIRTAFHGDLLAAIVLGEIAHHNLAPLVNRARSPFHLSEFLSSPTDTLLQVLLPTNAYSIAQATGIPRETVRRKIAGLVRRGWIAKDDKGNLFVTDRPVVEFEAFNEERLKDLLETAHAIDALRDDRPHAAARPKNLAGSRRSRAPA